MHRYDMLSRKLAGVMLILGPALIVLAAILAALGIGTTTGRWYDNALEGFLLALGFSLQLIGLLALCREIGRTRPLLGIITTLTSVLGTAGAILPSGARIMASGMLALGFTVEQLDVVHGGTDAMAPTDLYIIPFILCFFLNFFLLAFGLWRSKTAPIYAPILLAAGAVLFPIAQTSFEVNMPIYVAATVCWFLALAPLGIGFLRQEAPVDVRAAAGVVGS